MGLRETFQDKLRSGELHADAGQTRVAEKLASLAETLNQMPVAGNGGLLKRLFPVKPGPAPRGLYIHGAVGRGKTMLMDMFFAEVTNPPKARVHFHAFMQSVHAKRAAIKSSDVIGRIADDLAAHARLLCLDEMQITDIADAMIIGRLFEALEARGVCLVTTSNLPPDGLYRDGLNRQLFLPFIKKLETGLDVISLDSDRDYRLGRIKARETFIHPLGSETTAHFERLWQILTDNTVGEPAELTFLGRSLIIPRAAHGCARFSFADLCENPLAAADYLALAKACRTVFISDIPKLKASQRNAARRFILLIDTFYDARTRLVATAAAPPEQLYGTGDHHFEFARTISRLKEMQSASWWDGKIAET